MKKIGETEVWSDGCDWGVEYPNDPNIILCVDMVTAHLLAHLTGGRVVARDAFVSAWAKVMEPDRA
jgi:hypothetical protein